ncbi:hypothetical protein [Breoghania sp. L-A4]|uniref:hypothetical protein n=1 Tax=Breoghania sp. L-A4 TaxID=2304600 RepID=UPI0013C32C17|nr:hypothetical protein [Breoghania sp. L-A4]
MFGIDGEFANALWWHTSATRWMNPAVCANDKKKNKGIETPSGQSRTAIGRQRKRAGMALRRPIASVPRIPRMPW